MGQIASTIPEVLDKIHPVDRISVSMGTVDPIQRRTDIKDQRYLFFALDREGFLKITKEEAATRRVIEKVMSTRL